MKSENAMFCTSIVEVAIRWSVPVMAVIAEPTFGHRQ